MPVSYHAGMLPTSCKRGLKNEHWFQEACKYSRLFALFRSQIDLSDLDDHVEDGCKAVFSKMHRAFPLNSNRDQSLSMHSNGLEDIQRGAIKYSRPLIGGPLKSLSLNRGPWKLNK